MRSIVQFLDGAVENCLIEQWALVCRIAALAPAVAVETLLSSGVLNCTDRFPDCQVEF